MMSIQLQDFSAKSNENFFSTNINEIHYKRRNTQKALSVHKWEIYILKKFFLQGVIKVRTSSVVHKCL